MPTTGSGMRMAAQMTREVGASGTVTANDFMLMVDSALGAVVLTLPIATGMAGRALLFVLADATNTLTVLPVGGALIGGAVSRVLSSTGERLAIRPNGLNWDII